MNTFGTLTMSDIDIKIKMKDGKPEFQYAPIEAKKVDPDDALECDIKNEMSGSYGATTRGEAVSRLAYSAASAAGTKGLSHKLKSEIHAHASKLFAAAADEHKKAGSPEEGYHRNNAERHGKISAEMMK